METFIHLLDLIRFKNVVSPKILIERKKNREPKVSTTAVLDVSLNKEEEEVGDLTKETSEDFSLNLDLSKDLSTESTVPPPLPVENVPITVNHVKEKTIEKESKEVQTSFNNHNPTKEVQTSFIEPLKETPKKQSVKKKDSTPKENFPTASVSLEKPKKNISIDSEFSSTNTSKEERTVKRRKSLPTQPVKQGKKRMAIKRSEIENTDDCSTDEEGVEKIKAAKPISTKSFSEFTTQMNFETEQVPSPTIFGKKAELVDWDSLINSKKKEKKNFKMNESDNIKKLLFQEPSDIDTTFGDFLPAQENEKISRKRTYDEISAEGGEGDISKLLNALQKAFYVKTQKRLKLADEVSTKTAQAVQQKIEKLKEQRTAERNQIYENFSKASKEIEEKSAAQGRKLKASYQKFNTEISLQMKNHVELTNQLIQLKNEFQERLKQSLQKDEIEKVKLEKILDFDLSEMEKSLSEIERENSSVQRLADFIVSENIEI
jgi:hypothetical protein